MAYCLVGYMPCDKAVRSAILSEFDWAPSLKNIARIRKSREEAIAYSERGPVATGFNERGWDWTGKQYAADMDRASILFVNAIARERKNAGALSEFRARRDRALASVAA